MGNKRRRPECRAKSAGCDGDMMDEAASKAKRIRANRGNHEVEVTYTGEVGLHQCAIMCQKNPGHDRFIPRKNFNINHLPRRYRDNLLVDYVRATSDITCRLSLSRISEDRPATWPDSEKVYPFSTFKGENAVTVGTGCVCRVYEYTEDWNKNCPCDKCRGHGVRAWGEIIIHTACHVVFNNEEARHTKCQFFYDSPETDINKVLTLAGLKVYSKDIKGDWCELQYITHDFRLLDRFYEMFTHWRGLRRDVWDKYVRNNPPAVSLPGVKRGTNYVNHDLCILVSHPHGCTKVISIGAWTHRRVVDKDDDVNEWVAYKYTTPTCPGSSGASVVTLYKDNTRTALFSFPPHSQGGPDNDNNSGEGWEYFY